MEPLGPDDPRQVGQYRLRAVLGSGGMGKVFLGLSPGGFAVAVKVIHPALAKDGEFRARFAREVAAAQQVSGVYTAPVVDAGPDGEPPWLATAFVAGPSLAQAVAALGALPAGAVWRLAAGLAEALGAMHARGLVHRDLKPGNVLLAVDGPRVIDFGIARALEGTAVTVAGTVLGTPGFMSPEQAEGAEAGPPSDVWALGCVLAYAATGAPPFGAGSPLMVQYRVVHGEPALGGMSGPLRELAAGCLAKDPARRPALAVVLRAVAGQQPPDEAAFPGSFWPEPLAGLISSRRQAQEHLAHPARPEHSMQPVTRDLAGPGYPGAQGREGPDGRSGPPPGTRPPPGPGQHRLTPPRRPRRGPFRSPGVMAAVAAAVALVAFGGYAAVGKLASRPGPAPASSPAPGSGSAHAHGSAPAPSDPSGQRPPASLAGFTLRYTQEFTGGSVPAGWRTYGGPADEQTPDVAVFKRGMCSVSGGEAHFMASGVDSCGMEFTGAPQVYGAYFARVKGDSESAAVVFMDIFQLWPASNQAPPNITIYQDFSASRDRDYPLVADTLNGACGASPARACLERFRQSNRPAGVANNGTQWHTYGVEWTPSAVTWLIDGTVIYRVPASAVPSPARLPAQPADMVLQSQSLNGAGTPTRRETMTVDWVAQFSYNGQS